MPRVPVPEGQLVDRRESAMAERRGADVEVRQLPAGQRLEAHVELVRDRHLERGDEGIADHHHVAAGRGAVGDGLAVGESPDCWSARRSRSRGGSSGGSQCRAGRRPPRPVRSAAACSTRGTVASLADGFRRPPRSEPVRPRARRRSRPPRGAPAASRLGFAGCRIPYLVGLDVCAGYPPEPQSCGSRRRWSSSASAAHWWPAGLQWPSRGQCASRTLCPRPTM